MCYHLRKIHECPKETMPGEKVRHTVDSVIRCSSPKPCSGLGFGRLTQTYSGNDYCQRCLGSVVATRTQQPVSREFEIDFTGTEFVENVIDYVDFLLEFAMLSIHESLPLQVLQNNNLYPIHRLMITLLWETICIRCKVQLYCRCRPGRNESSWNVARYARASFAKDALQKFYEHTSGPARAREAVRVSNHVLRAVNQAVMVMGEPIVYDVEPVQGDDPEKRFHWIAHDMFDRYRPHEDTMNLEDEGGRLAMMELCAKFDIIELAASVIAHDPGVPDEIVRALGSRLLPLVLVTREHIATGNASEPAPFATPYDTFQAPNGTGTILPPSRVLRDGTFLPSLLEAVRQEALFIAGLYARPWRAPPACRLDDRLRGAFEITVHGVHEELVLENASMGAYERSRQQGWRTLLGEVHAGGVDWLTTADLPPTGDPAPQCFIHLSRFYEDVEMEEMPLHTNGGELEPQPLYRHLPIRLRNCVRSEDPHAFCMVSLAEWTFQRREVGDGKPRVVAMRARRCNQCMRPLVIMN